METEPILIAFGDVFKYSRDPNRQYVIIDVCNETHFDACEVLSAQDRLGIPGTGYRTDILEIVGKMGIQELIRGIENTLQAESPKIRKLLESASKKSARIIE